MIALSDAAAFCRSQARQVLVSDIASQPRTRRGVWRAAGSSDVVFKCLPAGAPELTLGSPVGARPTTVIETRER